MDDLPASTERLTFRPLELADAGSLAEIVTDASAWIRAKIEQQSTLGFSPWAVDHRASNQLAGFCGLFSRPVQGITMGYAIRPSFRNLGLATEAAEQVLAYCEARDILVYASIRPPNPASVRVLKKAGLSLVERQTDESGERHIYRRTLTS